MLPKTAEKKSANESPANTPADSCSGPLADSPAEVKEPEVIAPPPEDTATGAAVPPTEEPVPAEGIGPAPCAEGEVPVEGAPSGEEGATPVEEPALPLEPEPEPEPEPVGSRRLNLILLVES